MCQTLVMTKTWMPILPTSEDDVSRKSFRPTTAFFLRIRDDSSYLKRIKHRTLNPNCRTFYFSDGIDIQSACQHPIPSWRESLPKQGLGKWPDATTASAFSPLSNISRLLNRAIFEAVSALRLQSMWCAWIGMWAASPRITAFLPWDDPKSWYAPV